MGIAVAVGVFGLVGVHRTESRADAAAAADGPGVDGSALDWPAVEVFEELPVAEPLRVELVVETTTTTAFAEKTMITAPPLPETTTTTTAPPPPPETSTTTAAPKPAAPAKPRIANSGPEAQARVEAIADSSRWNWRAAGVRFNVSYYPGDCCHWGVYESAKSIIWIGPSAFSDEGRLRYVVLHELAHAWQYRQNRFADFITDYARWGFNTIGPALEAGADCVANVWGAAGSHYWRCTPDARALASRRLAGNWS
jgi:hypothetical protein